MVPHNIFKSDICVLMNTRRIYGINPIQSHQPSEHTGLIPGMHLSFRQSESPIHIVLAVMKNMNKSIVLKYNKILCTQYFFFAKDKKCITFDVSCNNKYGKKNNLNKNKLDNICHTSPYACII